MLIDVFENDLRRMWRMPPRVNLADWVEDPANFQLSAESSAEVGRIRLYPYQRGILEAMSDPRVESVTVMKSARVGYTKMINAAVAYHMARDPCTMMIVQPTDDDAKGYAEDEIEPMLRDTPALQGLVAQQGTRDTGNRIQRKKFPGGSLRIIGAHSPRGFRRVTIKVMMFDEVDGYAPTAGEEGDQIKLGIMRTETFWDRKILAGSTPTLDSTSRIKKRFEAGDQRYFHVPCPECKDLQILVWDQFRWSKGDPESVRYHCIHCDYPIPHSKKRWMMENAEKLGGGWIATKPEVKGSNGRIHASFHIWAAYSYSPNAEWPQLVSEWLASHKNIEERKTFINTVRGETYKGEGDAPDWKRLYDRREQYPTNIVPAGGRVLLAGVDVQANRIEVEIVAYGRNMRSWSVDYRVIMGKTDVLTGDDSAWPKLADILNETWPHAGCDAELQIQVMGVDTGYNTQAVYNWCSQWPGNRVLALDGRDSYQMVLGNPKPVDIDHAGKKKRRGLMLWPVGVSMIKTELYGWLKQEKPTDESGDPLPDGWCHFPMYGDEYFQQLTAEEIMPRLVKGYRRYHWEKTRERNEALDCRVYARAASGLLGIDRWTEERWRALEMELGLIERPKARTVSSLLRPKTSRAKDPYL